MRSEGRDSVERQLVVGYFQMPPLPAPSERRVAGEQYFHKIAVTRLAENLHVSWLSGGYATPAWAHRIFNRFRFSEAALSAIRFFASSEIVPRDC
jgi:hypothetical protein